MVLLKYNYVYIEFGLVGQLGWWLLGFAANYGGNITESLSSFCGGNYFSFNDGHGHLNILLISFSKHQWNWLLICANAFGNANAEQAILNYPLDNGDSYDSREMSIILVFGAAQMSPKINLNIVHQKNPFFILFSFVLWMGAHTTVAFFLIFPR